MVTLNKIPEQEPSKPEPHTRNRVPIVSIVVPFKGPIFRFYKGSEGTYSHKKEPILFTIDSYYDNLIKALNIPIMVT